MNERKTEIQVSEVTPHKLAEVTPHELSEVEGGVMPRITFDPVTGEPIIKTCTQLY